MLKLAQCKKTVFLSGQGKGLIKYAIMQIRFYMVFKKTFLKKRQWPLPLPFMANVIKNFHFLTLSQEKGNFHPTTGIPNSSSYLCCPPDDHLQEADPHFNNHEKGTEMHFWDPSQWDKCILGAKESYFNGKKDQNFKIWLRSGTTGLIPSPSSHGQPDRKMSLFFDDSPNTWLWKLIFTALSFQAQTSGCNKI